MVTRIRIDGIWFILLLAMVVVLDNLSHHFYVTVFLFDDFKCFPVVLIVDIQIKITFDKIL
jgi:hypothetical protein